MEIIMENNILKLQVNQFGDAILVVYKDVLIVSMNKMNGIYNTVHYVLQDTL